MVLSNLVVVGALIQIYLLLSKFYLDHSYSMSQLLAASQDLSSRIKLLESPTQGKKLEIHRTVWIEELLESLIKKNCSCNNFNLQHEQDQEVGSERADIMSEVISFCLLSGGLVILLNLFYSEYIKFVDMTSEGKKMDPDDQNRISVSIGEFFQYRYYGLWLPFDHP
jgi:hypothetical protein